MAGVTTTAVDWNDVVLFVLFAYALSWLAWFGLKPVFPPLAIRTFLAMFGPTFAAVAVIRLKRGHHLRHQLRQSPAHVFNSTAACALALLLVGTCMAAGLGLSLVTGDLKFPGSSGQDLFQALPFPVALFIYWVTAFGEEYGWRGFLQPALAPLGGAQASVMIAVIFAVWHAPIILIDGFNFPRHHVIGMFDMLVFAVPFTVLQSWLRSATGGIAAATAAHATVNIGTGLLYSSTARTTSIIAAPVGLLGTVPFALIALLLVITGRLWSHAKPLDSE
jgi:membrane protease YdiL (CAAX protease family)